MTYGNLMDNYYRIDDFGTWFSRRAFSHAKCIGCRDKFLYRDDVNMPLADFFAKGRELASDASDDEIMVEGFRDVIDSL